MKKYIQIIGYTQKILLTVGILTLMILPLLILYYPNAVMRNSAILYDFVHITVFFVMLIRPLADIFTNTTLIRPLVILRKGAGVVSASIVVSFILAKLLGDPIDYISSMFTLPYWSFTGSAILAHLADITAILLLVTSNNFSKRILGAGWKRIQKLSYVYFYASALYVYISFGSITVFVYMVIITAVTSYAFFINRQKQLPVIV